MSNEPLEEQPVEADRDVPSVAQANGNRLLPLLIFGGIATIGVAFVIIDGQNQSGPPSYVAPDEQEFRVNRDSAGQPYVQPEPIVEAPPPEPDPTPVLTEETQSPSASDRALEAEALRLARAQAARLQERKLSPQLVYTGNTGSGRGAVALSPNVVTPDQLRQATATQTGGPGPGGVLGGPQGPGDARNANQAFLNANANRGFETVSASQLENLSTLVPQGTLISGTLETAIQSDLPGSVRAVVSENIYSFDQSAIMVPRGTRLVGQYRSGVVQGQTRVFVIWDRLIRPDGISVQLGSVGTDALGRSGLEGFVDTHFLERFGSSILLSLIDGGLRAGVAAIDNDEAAGIALNGGNQFSRAAELALENSINIPPTIHVNQGERIKIFVGRDLDFAEVN